MIHFKHRFPNILVALFLIAGIGCANRKFEPIVIDGQHYCVTEEKTFSEEWYSCYLRGISCAWCREEACLEKARNELLLAITRGKDDSRWVRTYGTHRLPEYFPNRELGVVYYYHYKLTGDPSDLDKSIGFLNTSLNQCSSAKAKYYLNKVRKEKLLLTGEDIEGPLLEIDPFPRMTDNPHIIISGLVRDDTYVGYIYITLNHEKPLSLLELSQEFSCSFQQEIVLQPGINHLSIKAVDLIGREEEKKIDILLDQEGPMIFFAEQGAKDFKSQNLVKGLLYDPSDIVQFTLNEKKVEIIKIETDEDPNTKVSEKVYEFKYRLSFNEWEKGVLSYSAEDSLQNISEGILKIFKEEEEAVIQKVYSLNDELSRDELLRIASASKAIATDLESPIPFYQISKRRSPDTIRIEISQFPEETFEDDVSPKIEIWASCQIREIYIKDEPILSMYGLRWAPFLNSILKRFMGKDEEGRFLFHRMIKLEKEGENIIPVVVVDQFGKFWESSIRIVKKVRQIHELDKRWRIIIPLIGDNQGEDPRGDKQVENEQFGRKMDLTNQIWEAFIDQSRFKVIDHRNLPILLREEDLRRYIGSPFLGLKEEQGIWIDIFLLCSVEETENSFSLMASWVDFETGEVLAIKDVYEEIDSLGLYNKTAWAEGLREHAYQNCCVLADKFEKHFPLCEGKVMHLNKETVETSICKKDGLKNGMKLIIFEDIDKDEDYRIIGEAKVEEVSEIYSLAQVIEKHEAVNINDTFNDTPINLWVISR